MTESKDAKKVNLADAIRAKLEQKKQQQSGHAKQGGYNSGPTHTMKSQNTKKPNNQRRRTGGS